jgi:hypothetical protein
MEGQNGHALPWDPKIGKATERGDAGVPRGDTSSYGIAEESAQRPYDVVLAPMPCSRGWNLDDNGHFASISCL